MLNGNDIPLSIRASQADPEKELEITIHVVDEVFARAEALLSPTDAGDQVVTSAALLPRDEAGVVQRLAKLGVRCLHLRNEVIAGAYGDLVATMQSAEEVHHA